MASTEQVILNYKYYLTITIITYNLGLSMSDVIDWSPDKMLEIILKNEDSFLLIKETLTRIGIASFKNKTLWQSCHILHKRGKYYIVSFKELFLLDGRESTFSVEDLNRRNSITKLLVDWDLCTTVNDLPEQIEHSRIKIIRHSDKNNWFLENKYSIGNS